MVRRLVFAPLYLQGTPDVIAPGQA